MINYGLVTTRFDVWFKVAQSLRESANPIFWLDVRNKLEVFEKEFPDCQCVTLVDYNDWCKGDFRDLPLHGENIQLPKNWAKVKDIMKLIFNRYNALGQWRNLDMDSAVYNIFLNLNRLFPKKPIDLFIFTETPHTPVDFAIYELCKLKGIPTLMLHQHNIAPVTLFKWDIGAPSIRLKRKRIPAEVQLKINTKIQNHFDQVVTDEGHETWYVKSFNATNEKRLKFFSKRLWTRIKEIRGNIKGLRTSRSVYRGYQTLNPRLIDPIKAEIFKIKGLKHLEAAFELKVTQDLPKSDYILFPLHYEPERTTVPDGGDYYDQLKAICDLRSKIGVNIPLLVKEHFLTFSAALEGYTGRSKYFYDVISALPNTYLVDYRLNTRNLIKHSRMVATVCGSVLYEAAALGKPAVMFGHSWFETLPGIYKFQELQNSNLEFQKVDYEEFVNHIKQQIADYGVLGAAHDSWLRPLKELLENDYCIELEIDTLVDVLPDFFHDLMTSKDM